MQPSLSRAPSISTVAELAAAKPSLKNRLRPKPEPVPEPEPPKPPAPPLTPARARLQMLRMPVLSNGSVNVEAASSSDASSSISTVDEPVSSSESPSSPETASSSPSSSNTTQADDGPASILLRRSATVRARHLAAIQSKANAPPEPPVEEEDPYQLPKLKPQLKDRLSRVLSSVNQALVVSMAMNEEEDDD